MSGENDIGQDLADPETVLAQLDEALDLELPGGNGGEPGQHDENTDRDKIGQAFKGLKGTLKLAKSVIKKELGEKKLPPAEPAPPQPPPTQPRNEAQAATLLRLELNQKARENLLRSNVEPDQAPDLLQAEFNRLYMERMQEFRDRTSAGDRAASVADEVLGAFEQLDDGDKKQIKETLKSLDILDQANPDSVRGEVFRYIGEKSVKTPAKPKKKEESPPQIPTGHAAALGSSVAALGSPAVKLTEVGKDEDDYKPPKPLGNTERSEMRKLGLNPNNREHVKTYWEAHSSRSTHRGQDTI